MNYKEYYNDRLKTPDEAVRLIKSGDRVVVQHATGEPSALLDAMVRNKDLYENVEIVHMVAMGKAEYTQSGMEQHFRHNALFVGGSTKKAVQEGRADYTPTFFFEVPKLFKTELPVDVALVHVTPPNEAGEVSLGISCDYTKPACDCARLVIAQVNKNMPWTYGDTVISVEDIDCFVECDAPIIELAKAGIGEIESMIGAHCAKLINDGDTLQLGIGAIPDAVLSFLGDKKDLGIHSEMFADGVVELAKKGVITNSKKKINTGKMIATFLMGTKNLYDFVDRNEDVLMRPVDYVNNPAVIMQEDNIVCINSCVQVDLMGQVVSESIGEVQISGVGGQVDFIRGASMAKNGRSIIAMPSTVKGKTSKIVTKIDDYAAVTTSRNDVDYVVTEYGIAHLKGQTLKERSKRLIKIAHPDFREELIKYHNTKFHDNFSL